jgi:hypothetical protein
MYRPMVILAGIDSPIEKEAVGKYMVSPDDFGPLPEDIREAQSMSEGFVREWRRAMFETRSEGFVDNVPRVESPVKLGDVQKNIVRVAVHCRYFLLRLGKFPCIQWKSGEMPICSINEFFGSEKGARDYETVEKTAIPSVSRKMLRDFRDKFMSRKDHPVMVSPAKGERFLSDGLKGFLTTRLAASRIIPEPPLPMRPNRTKGGGGSAPPPPVSVTAGIFNNGLISVEVECKSKGRRIHSSPAYFVDWTYFGQPSPRVIGWLPPGRYVFATDGKRQDFLADPAVFSIPTQFNPVLKRF